MALDTIKKRASAMNFVQRGSVLPFADGEINAGDNRQFDGFYSGEFSRVLNAQRVVTVWGTDTFGFTGEDGEWASVIISGTVYRVENDGGNFLWDTVGHRSDQRTFEQSLDENTTVEFQGIWHPFNVTWLGYTDSTHIFTVELAVEDECLRANKKMTDELTIPLNEEVVEKNENPTSWEDFNYVHRRWNFIKMTGVKGKQTIICQEDISDEPRLEDYSI